jgi:hypothetical protein
LNNEYIKIIQKIDPLANNLLPKKPLDKYPATKAKIIAKRRNKIVSIKGKT